MSSTLSRIREERLAKIQKLKELGINPYPSKSEKTLQNIEIIKNFKKLINSQQIIAGRIRSIREHGSLKFINLEDSTGTLQLIIKKDQIKKTNVKNQTLGWEELTLLDVGDFLEAEGKVILSKTNEKSIDAVKIRILSKSIRPLPDKWEGLKDQEARYRRRYLDMTMNPQIRDRFSRKAVFWNTIRKFLNKNGFLEINIPVLEHVTGGADANPFVTHYDALNQDFYLRISHELPLKRLIGGGFEKVYDLGARFRNEGFSDEHLPEHVALEWYWAYADYKDGMKFLEKMFKEIVMNVYGKYKFNIKGFNVDFSKPWKIIRFEKIIRKRFGIDIYKDSLKKMNQILIKNNVILEGALNKNRIIDNLWKLIRKEIGGPAFLIEHPKFLSPLSKSNSINPKITDRGQPIIAGSELGNFWSELNDPVDQFERFKSQQEMRDAGDDEAQMMDIDYVEMLEYGMPPTVGFGISERVFWFLENITAKEGVAFPPVKLEYEETTKEIYDIKKQPVNLKDIKRIKTELDNEAGNLIYECTSCVKDNKLFSVDSSVGKLINSINIGIAIIEGVNIVKTNKLVEEYKNRVVKKILKFVRPEMIDNLPEISAYNKLYNLMNLDKSGRKPSSEVLLRRVFETSALPNINTCVDICNTVVLLTQVSTGVFDYDKISFPTILKMGKKGDKVDLIGNKIIEVTDKELCYYDFKGVYNIDLNYRDADRTKVTENTKNIYINIDGIEGTPYSRVGEALELLTTMIVRYCGGKIVLSEIISKEFSK